LQYAKAWDNYSGSGNLTNVHPAPEVIEYSDDAKDVMYQLTEYCEQMADWVGEPFDTLWTRVGEKVKRLALIYACSVNCPPSEVSVEAVKWAAEIVCYLTDKMIWICSQRIMTNDFEKHCKKVQDYIKSKQKGVTRRNTLRKFCYIKQKELDDIIARLYDMELIDIVKNPIRANQVLYIAK
jgi:hypothetical protein